MPSEINLDPGDVIITKIGRFVVEDDGNIVPQTDEKPEPDSWRVRDSLL